MILLYCYLLIGLVLLLTPTNLREWLACTAELHTVYWPRVPAWVLALLLGLLFLLVWPLTLHFTRH